MKNKMIKMLHNRLYKFTKEWFGDSLAKIKLTEKNKIKLFNICCK